MSRDSRITGMLLGMAAAWLLAASVACSWFVSGGATIRWRILFRVVCHGIPERCWTLWGVPMPICARCTGIYCGILLGIVLFVLFASRLRGAIGLGTLLVLITPLAVDGVTQAIGFRESSNLLRMFTGILAGGGFAIWALARIETNARRGAQHPHSEMVTSDSQPSAAP